jgi:hypothetical protein
MANGIFWPFRVKRALLYQLSYQPTKSAAAFNPAGKLIPCRNDAGQIKSGANTNSHAQPAQEFFPPGLVCKRVSACYGTMTRRRERSTENVAGRWPTSSPSISIGAAAELVKVNEAARK